MAPIVSLTSSDQDYQQFIHNVKRKIGIDLSLYKENQMKRRLTSFREKRGFNDFQSFFKAIEKDEQLLNEFVDRITINVTEFFRNSNRWQVLAKKIIPNLPNKSKIRCWSAACSTGEEPYTLSIILSHYFPELQFEILATDIDEIALKKANEGIFTERSLKEVPKEIIQKYFRRENGLYYLIPEVKKNIKFKKHDLLVDDFEKDFDLIVCRNVMIYFTEEAKHDLYYKFSDALKEKGVLFVGSTEQIFNPAQYKFKVVDNFFYQKASESPSLSAI
ncbi:chemotaxis protein CheR [Vulcanibacillus modesticaldus]|uniref:protein-glutamate O-methyltransferase n=1 Tax=Vulcanibacillus modesticaldus TaxID=337097 RepID=A0A1D2YTK4_9BACI|nr:protein-glutamate O-methyltransferase CheR [Vulcanibacillus modesticaldus]OEF99028.1 chemotaxis protein CheR [Vulcanibacillus modesticaldus]